MQKKTLVLGLAITLALALIAPVLAQEPPPGEVPTLSLEKASAAAVNAKQAKKIARKAKRIAKKAERKANSAGKRVGALGARVDALAADAAATAAQTSSVGGSSTTAEEDGYVALGGPSVTVTAPASGLVEVWAQVTIETEGAVSLYQDGQQAPGQAPNDACDAPPGALLSQSQSLGEPITLSTPTGAPLLWCGSEGPPAPMLFKVSPGEHTFELRYADCGCTPDDAVFRDRTLTVAPRR